MRERFRIWRWRLHSWLWRNAPFTFAGTVVWPDEEPLLPTSRAVLAHTSHFRYWSPWAAKRAERDWQDEQVPG